MSLIYVVNARLPTEKAHGLQIMKSMEAFAGKGVRAFLIVPRKINMLKSDPFEYYKVKKSFKIIKIPTLDLIWLPILPQRITFYIQSFTFNLLALIYILLRFSKKNNIFYSRDYASLVFLNLFGFKPVAELHDYRSNRAKGLIRYILNKSRQVIVNSMGTKELLLNHYAINKEIKVIPNGVDIDFFQDNLSSESARRRLLWPEDKIVIGYIGNLKTVGQEKGIPDLIESFSQVGSNVELRIIGGPKEMVETYSQMAKDLNLESRIFFSGYVPYSQIPTYYRAMDAVVIPLPRNMHSQTTSPIKLFEALAAGKPIICADFPSLRDYLSDEDALFYDPENVSDLADKIKLVSSDQALRERLSQRSLQIASRYSWDQRATKILDFIK